MLLSSLTITGFRGFEQLEIPRLGRVNLIVGKNATGKTTVLEAISLLARGTRAPEELDRILLQREELFNAADTLDAVDWARAFYDVGASDLPKGFVVASNLHKLTMTLAYGYPPPAQHANAIWTILEEPTPEDLLSSSLELALVTETNNRKRITPIKGVGLRQPLVPDPQLASVSCMMLHARGYIDDEPLRLWENITLTEGERVVLDALRLIDPDIERINYVDRRAVRSGLGTGPRALVKRKDRPPEPLSSLGDGMVRLLEISLALANARGGFLLIDEVESGIHYTVQPDLWRLLITVAAQLDIQVFATTHSWDCVEAFQQASGAHPAEGMLIRIDKDEKGSYAVLFDEEDLQIATRESIEVR